MHASARERPIRGLPALGFLQALTFALMLCLLARAAAAAPDGSSCRLECGAQFTEPAQNPISVQTCLIRCAARAAAMGNANVTAATIMPAPQTPWTAGSHSGRAPARMLAQTAAQKMGDRQGAAHSRHAPISRNQASLVTAHPPAKPQPGPGPLPAAGSPPLFSSLIAAGAAPPGPATAPAGPPGPETGRGSFGAVHLAPAPSRSYGMVVGAADRVSAHRAAESDCIGPAGATCRAAGDFTDRCASVAHALRPKGALVVTEHPSTFTVTGATIGTGPTREDAERQAGAACAQIGRGGVCRITETRCAG